MKATITAALLSAVCLLPAALAQQQAQLGPAVHKQSDISFVSGGATEQEAHELHRVANKYPMQLRFVIGSDPSAGKGVRVTIKNLKGEKVIEAVSDGPAFYFNPPSGRWTIDAEYNGETVSKTVDLIGRRYIVLEFDFKGGGG
jgi:hypothetical protein